MRTIKFRIWDKQLKAFLYRLPEKHHLDWERFDVQQFTGLLDSKGKEVYEGDIVRATIRGETFITKQGIIKWSDYLKALVVNIFGEHIDDSNTIGIFYELEVIGNIYENKDREFSDGYQVDLLRINESFNKSCEDKVKEVLCWQRGKIKHIILDECESALALKLFKEIDKL